MSDPHDPQSLLGPSSDSLLRERANEWAADRSSHLSEREIAALCAAVADPASLEHLLDCTDCAMRTRAELAAPAAAPARRNRPRLRLLRNATVAAAAGFAIFLLGQWRAAEGPAAAPEPARSMAIFDPAALQRSGAGEIRMSRMVDGRMAILVNCECPGDVAAWQLEAPNGQSLRGRHAFEAGAPVFKEFVLEVELTALLPQRSGQLRLSVAGEKGVCADWLFRVRP
jgi:hypothetical protein